MHFNANSNIYLVSFFGNASYLNHICHSLLLSKDKWSLARHRLS